MRKNPSNCYHSLAVPILEEPNGIVIYKCRLCDVLFRAYTLTPTELKKINFFSEETKKSNKSEQR